MPEKETVYERQPDLVPMMTDMSTSPLLMYMTTYDTVMEYWRNHGNSGITGEIIEGIVAGMKAYIPAPANNVEQMFSYAFGWTDVRPKVFDDISEDLYYPFAANPIEVCFAKMLLPIVEKMHPVDEEP